jgi:hypothetical protein
MHVDSSLRFLKKKRQKDFISLDPLIFGISCLASPTTQTPSTKMTSIPPKLTAIVHDAPGKHTATVIFMHGFGDSGAGW